MLARSVKAHHWFEEHFSNSLELLHVLNLPRNNSSHPLYAAVQDGVLFEILTPCHHSMPVGMDSTTTASRLAHPCSVAIGSDYVLLCKH